jgi:hypothetical protein
LVTIDGPVSAGDGVVVRGVERPQDGRTRHHPEPRCRAQTPGSTGRANLFISGRITYLSH